MLRWSRTLAASTDDVELFCLALRNELAGRWFQADVFAAELVFREVLANAVEHGGLYDRSHTIAVDLAVDGGRLKARVSDHGPGFPMPPPSSGGPERGRGLQILSYYTAAHRFEDGGRTVTFELALRPPEPEE